LLPRKEAELRSGPVSFGPVTLRKEGVVVGEKTYRWPDLECSLRGGHLIVVPAGDRFGWGDRKEVPLADIPNFLVLVELIARVGNAPIDPNLTIPVSDRARLSR